MHWRFTKRPEGGWFVLDGDVTIGHVAQHTLWSAYGAEGWAIRTALRTRDDAAAVVWASRPSPRGKPGDSAHTWALDGPPLRNSTSEASTMLDCPKCSDVILDVIDLRSGPLSVPRNVHSTLGRVWYARCPACGWTSPDRPSEWTLLEAVNEAREA